MPCELVKEKEMINFKKIGKGELVAFILLIFVVFPFYVISFLNFLKKWLMIESMWFDDFFTIIYFWFWIGVFLSPILLISLTIIIVNDLIKLKRNENDKNFFSFHVFMLLIFIFSIFSIFCVGYFEDENYKYLTSHLRHY